MAEEKTDPLQRCNLHEMQNCAECWPPTPGYRRSLKALDVPPNCFVSVLGGRGVYHHPDCPNVTGDWEGSETATLGERVVHTAEELATSSLRPAECCHPPLLNR